MRDNQTISAYLLENPNTTQTVVQFTTQYLNLDRIYDHTAPPVMQLLMPTGWAPRAWNLTVGYNLWYNSTIGQCCLKLAPMINPLPSPFNQLADSDKFFFIFSFFCI